MAEQESENRLRIMVDSMSFACMFFDTEGKLLDCNRTAVEFFGCKDKKELLEQFFDFSPEMQPDGRYSKEKVEFSIRGAFEKGKDVFLWTHQKKDGSRLPVEVTLVRVDWQDSFRVVAYLRDMTKLTEAEEQLSKAKEEIERALESEVQYNRAKSNFLSRMSHELRTPMNAILGMTEIARRAAEKNDWESCIEKFDKIEDAAKHLLGILNDVLDMAGIDTGRFELEPRQFSFSEAMRSIVEETGAKAAAKKQTFTVDIDPKIAKEYDTLVGDERRIKQVLNKLLSNAVKFTPESGRIGFSARPQAHDKDGECCIHFEVCDNGIGIGKEVQERLGRSFEQAHNSITREYGGMGLGLSLTRRIVEMMKGRVWVDAEPGKGSRFMCEIYAGVARTQDAPAPEAERQAMPHNLTGRQILIVDDVEINRLILRAVLEDTGASLDEAQDGAEAVKLFVQKKYDLVLMDLHMPVMDGFTATKNMRSCRAPWAKTVPVISVSAESGAALPAKLQEAGISAHLTKPVEMEALFEVINGAIFPANSELVYR